MSSHDDERRKLIELRKEMEREGIKLSQEVQEFMLGENIKVQQVRSSVAGHGSGAFHTYLKETRLEEERLRRQKEEWDRAVYRLQKLKEERAANERLQNASKNHNKNKKKKLNKKTKGGNNDSSSDSDDDDTSGLDFVSLFQSVEPTTITTSTGESTTTNNNNTSNETTPTEHINITKESPSTDKSDTITQQIDEQTNQKEIDTTTENAKIDTTTTNAQKRKATTDLDDIIEQDDAEAKKTDDNTI